MGQRRSQVSRSFGGTTETRMSKGLVNVKPDRDHPLQERQERSVWLDGVWGETTGTPFTPSLLSDSQKGQHS